ncbi:hypothetical protein HZH66_010889 [Vespula vulgaris]|uniref:Uncharacterized protein n=1 Tax=Vespula vulgaris TaxID=7454 RepID=A0A834JJ73_VESVU|nr:probable serine/threonine-protein kinase kinX [Vespula vulgaris]KAF7388122.1 hypothetical protein HZH66_010889 [Vespula vulgaris]
MKLNGSLCILYLFYFINTNGVGCKSHSFPNSTNVEKISSPRSIEDNKENLNIVEKYRDKRALGLILSGLAQIFGYTPTPIQLASLPNPVGSDNNPGASGNNQSSFMPPMQPSNSPNQASTASPTQTMPISTTTTRPRQRETIRFTGVVNFGNRSDVVGHLQQYERIFHGTQTTTPASSSSSSSSSPPSMPVLLSTTPSSFSTMSSFDIRESLKYRPPLLSPYLVKIPLPIAPNLPPPISPTTKINFSIKNTNMPRRKEQEIVYRKNENIENYTVENKEIRNEKDVGIPESKFQHNVYVSEPYWKKLHEERITQLERKQQECAEKLKEREKERNHSYREEDHSGQSEGSRDRENDSDDREREYSGNIKEDTHGNNEDEGNDEESENSRERYEEHPGYPREGPTNEKQKNTEDYDDYDEDDSSRNDERQEDLKEPITKVYDNNYTNVKYDKPLPISDYYEKERPPQQLRDSYGEILDNRALVDERIANYYDYVNNQQTNPQDPPNISDYIEESEEKYEERPESKIHEQNNEDPYKKLREEYAIIPLENKYEEYNLENTDQSEKDDRNESENPKDENDPTSNKNDPIQNSESTKFVDKTKHVNSNELKSKKVSNIRNNVIPIKNKSFNEFAIVKHSPYILPIRYVYGPEELEEAKARRFQTEKVKKEEDHSRSINDARSTIDEKKSQKQKLKAEDLTPKIGLPERLTEKKLHEGESKELQIWPAPFDFVFDSTEQTNVRVPVNTNENSKENIHRPTTIIPTRTMIYERNPSTLRYLAPFVPMHYATYQQPTLYLNKRLIS